MTQQPWTGMIYNGTWIPAEDGATTEIVSPLDGQVIAEVGEASAGDVARAAEAAAVAGAAWNALGVNDKVAVFNKAAAIIERDADEIREWIQKEVGSVPGMTGVEIEYGTELVRQGASLCVAPRGEILPAMKPGQQNYARRIPRGVVGVIGPWNAPFMLSLRNVAPALALGNGVVLKPAPQTPVSGGVLIARIFEEAGLPPGVLQVVPGDGPTGAALTTDPKVNSIAFTGSTAIGRLVGKAAGENLKPVQLELGGNNAYIVLEDANMEAAVGIGLAASVFANGQGCLVIGRHLVHESIAEEYTAAITAAAKSVKAVDPRTNPETMQGPLVNEKQLDHVVDLIKRAEAAGARKLAGEDPEGLYFSAHVYDHVAADNPLFVEETFAPVVSITTFKTDEEAIALANASEYGLTCSIMTADTGRAMAIANGVHSGNVHINDITALAVAWAPLGGVGASGNGTAFGGSADLDAYTAWQWVTQS
jgi:benzaldehyde dehydrogenase (NAD)